MDLVQTLILAIIQGITEWLPVSSTGHLNVVRTLMDLNTMDPSYVFFDFMLHVGTLLVVLAVFKTEIAGILKAIFKRDFQTDDGKLALYVIVGSIPTAIIGFTLSFLFREQFEVIYLNLLTVGIALLFNGCILFISKRGTSTRRPDYASSLLMGVAQGAAIIPGISRSGATISTGLLRKMSRAESFKLSFLLSLPAVAGAVLAESRNLPASDVDMVVMLLGVITSMIVGYMFLVLLRRLVMSGKFHWFAYYCWIVGLAIVTFSVLQ